MSGWAEVLGYFSAQSFRGWLLRQTLASLVNSAHEASLGGGLGSEGWLLVGWWSLFLINDEFKRVTVTLTIIIIQDITDINCIS